MGHAGRCISIVLPAILICTHAHAQIGAADGLIECALHFQARADWLRALNKNEDTVRLMELHSQVLLASANKAIGPTDWRMPVYGSPALHAPPSYDFEVVYGSLDEMTRFAEIGYDKTGLPLCVEDEKCIACTQMLNESGP